MDSTVMCCLPTAVRALEHRQQVLVRPPDPCAQDAAGNPRIKLKILLMPVSPNLPYPPPPPAPHKNSPEGEGRSVAVWHFVAEISLA